MGSVLIGSTKGAFSTGLDDEGNSTYRKRIWTLSLYRTQLLGYLIVCISADQEYLQSNLKQDPIQQL
jgi:hypothetical protein